MIVFEDVRLASELDEGDAPPVINMTIPTDRRIAILCPDTFSQISIVNVLAGLAVPPAGRIIRHARLSFPVGFLGGLSPTLPARLNVARVARLYRADVDEVLHFVEAVTAIGDDFDEPFGSLTKMLQFHIASVLAYAIPFDAYLFNGAIGHPGRQFVDKYTALFEARTESSGAIMATPDINTARKFCDIGAVLHRGALQFYETMDDAIAVFETLRPNRLAVQKKLVTKFKPEAATTNDDIDL